MIMGHAKPLALLRVLVAICFMSGCSSLTRSDKPADTVWWLEPYTAAAPASAGEQPMPLFLTVTVVPGLDSDRILTLSADAELKPFAGARWADRLPELAGSLLGRSLQASGRFELLQYRPRKDEPGCELQLEVQAFFADLGAGGRTSGVSVAAGGFLRCSSAEPLAVDARAQVAVGHESMTAVVAAFQQATNRVTQDIIEKISYKQ